MLVIEGGSDLMAIPEAAHVEQSAGNLSVGRFKTGDINLMANQSFYGETLSDPMSVLPGSFWTSRDQVSLLPDSDSVIRTVWLWHPERPLVCIPATDASRGSSPTQ
uniref:Uncharacterized protein n=1 Tax=Anguilla anguilla TaxID=7936 RepID=A0A0E9SCB1_ANGAN